MIAPLLMVEETGPATLLIAEIDRFNPSPDDDDDETTGGREGGGGTAIDDDDDDEDDDDFEGM